MDNNNVQAGLANINAKTDINAKAQLANSVHNQLGGTTNYENKYTSKNKISFKFMHRNK